MGIEVKRNTIVTATMNVGDVEFETDKEDANNVVIRLNGYEVEETVSLADLEAALKALKGEDAEEKTEDVAPARKPGEFRVGDKVRVVNCEHYRFEAGNGLVGTVVSVDGAHAEAEPGRPIVVDVLRNAFGNDCSLHPDYVDYASYELELIEGATAS